MLVCNVHEVVAEGGVVVVLESRGSKVAYNEGDMGMREACAPVCSEEFSYFWSTAEAGDCDRRHASFVYADCQIRMRSQRRSIFEKPRCRLALLLQTRTCVLSNVKTPPRADDTR